MQKCQDERDKALSFHTSKSAEKSAKRYRLSLDRFGFEEDGTSEGEFRNQKSKNSNRRGEYDQILPQKFKSNKGKRELTEEELAVINLQRAIDRKEHILSPKTDFSAPKIDLNPANLKEVVTDIIRFSSADATEDLFNFNEDAEPEEGGRDDLLFSVKVGEEDEDGSSSAGEMHSGVPKDSDAAPLDDVRTLWLLSPTNPIRVFCYRIIGHRHFETVMFLLICVSSICLAIDNPLLNPGSLTASVIGVLDVVIAYSFAAELLLKIIVHGAFFAPRAYFMSDHWNKLDFLIVLVSFLSLYASDQLKSFRVLRSLKALRTLRLSRKFTGIKLIVSAVFEVLPDVAYAIVICGAFVFIFGIFRYFDYHFSKVSRSLF